MADLRRLVDVIAPFGDVKEIVLSVRALDESEAAIFEPLNNGSVLPNKLTHVFLNSRYSGRHTYGMTVLPFWR